MIKAPTFVSVDIFKKEPQIGIVLREIEKKDVTDEHGLSSAYGFIHPITGQNMKASVIMTTSSAKGLLVVTKDSLYYVLEEDTRAAAHLLFNPGDHVTSKVALGITNVNHEVIDVFSHRFCEYVPEKITYKIGSLEKQSLKIVCNVKNLNEPWLICGDKKSGFMQALNFSQVEKVEKTEQKERIDGFYIGQRVVNKSSSNSPAVGTIEKIDKSKRVAVVDFHDGLGMWKSSYNTLAPTCAKSDMIGKHVSADGKKFRISGLYLKGDNIIAYINIDKAHHNGNTILTEDHYLLEQLNCSFPLKVFVPVSSIPESKAVDRMTSMNIGKYCTFNSGQKKKTGKIIAVVPHGDNAAKYIDSPSKYLNKNGEIPISVMSAKSRPDRTCYLIEVADENKLFLKPIEQVENITSHIIIKRHESVYEGSLNDNEHGCSRSAVEFAVNNAERLMEYRKLKEKLDAFLEKNPDIKEFIEKA